MSSGTDFAREIFFAECSAILILRRNFSRCLFGKQQNITVIRHKRHILAPSDFAVYIVFKLFAPSVGVFSENDLTVGSNIFFAVRQTFNAILRRGLCLGLGDGVLRFILPCFCGSGLLIGEQCIDIKAGVLVKNLSLID